MARRRGSHRGASVRGTHAAGYGVSGAGDAQRPVSDARGREHRAADPRGPRAVPAGAVETRRPLARDAGAPPGHRQRVASPAGAPGVTLKSSPTFCRFHPRTTAMARVQNPRNSPTFAPETLDAVAISVPEVCLTQLREAANCYIAGYPNAAVSLSRTAIELSLRAAVARHVGDRVVNETELMVLLRDYVPRCRLLTKGGIDRAHRVRMTANKALHDGVETDLAEAREVFEAARSVVMELPAK